MILFVLSATELGFNRMEKMSAKNSCLFPAHLTDCLKHSVSVSLTDELAILNNDNDGPDADRCVCFYGFVRARARHENDYK
jgi:hypothetical protein